MKRSFLFLLLFSLIYAFNEPFAGAQLWKMKRLEASGGIGPSFFFGDIGGFSKDENILGIKDMSIRQTRFNFNLNLKYRVLEDLNLRLSFTKGWLHATDSRGLNSFRGMESSTSIIEPAILGEFYFIKNKAENSYLFSKGQPRDFSRLMDNLDFYIFAGIGGVSYSVKGNAELLNNGIERKGFAPVIPAGIGSTLIFSADFDFGVELGGRYSFSDQLDAYTSQYSRSNDVYYFLNFTLTYKLRTGSKGFPTFRRT